MIGIGTLGSLGLNGGILYDAAASAFFARLTNQPTPARATLYNNLFVSLRQNGILPLLDTLYIMAAADAQAAGQNLVQNAYNLTAVNAPVFTADRGYAGDAVSARLSTNCDISATANFTPNSGHLSVYNRTARAVNAYSDIGANYGGGGSIIYPYYADGNTYFRLNDDSAGVVDTGSQGHYLVSRTSSTVGQGYKKAVAFGGNLGAPIATIPSGTIPNILASNDGAGIFSRYSTDQIAAASIGGGLTGAQVTAFYNAIQAYMTGVGANV